MIKIPSIQSKTLFIGLNTTLLFPVVFGLISGFSVFYFLYFFEAYGIQKGLSYSGHSHLFRSISFGILTFLYLSLFEAFVKSKLKITLIKEYILWYAGLVFLGSNLIFLLFNFFWNWQEWNLEAYGLIVKEFPLMMVIPLSFYLLIQSFNKQKAKAVEVQYLLFQSENGKDQLKLKLNDFLYASSSENYITIFYLSNQKSEQHLIRKPLKVLEEELNAFSEIERSHRSYLVNRLNIQSVRQIKRKVYIEIQDETLPVSKQFQDQFLR